MPDVYLIAVEMQPVEKRSARSVRQLGAATVRGVMERASVDRVDALYVGNMMSGLLSRQQQIGALIADESGLRGIEAGTAEGACSSGALAARWAYMAVASGIHRLVVACGVERMTHVDRAQVTGALATASDWESEGGCGETFISLNARLMALYMAQYGIPAEAFAPLSIAAHRNALSSPHALLKRAVDVESYLQSRMLVEPIRLFDASPVCDGAAALLFASRDVAYSAAYRDRPKVKVVASSVATDSLSLAKRRNPLVLDGVVQASRRAYAQADVSPLEIDLFELHDAYTIMSVLSLECSGFAEIGEGTRLGLAGEIGLAGRLPIATMGGLKARGHPVGATGAYQLAEAYTQLTGAAGANQVANARIAMTQNFGGTGATVVTHILRLQP